jgi:hypothetical protein
MKKAAILVASILVGVSAYAVRADDTTTTSTATTAPAKKGNPVGRDAKAVGGDVKKGGEAVVHDSEKGVKFVGSETKKAGAATVHGVEKVGSEMKKVVPHKKAASTKATPDGKINDAASPDASK